jgi:hypothetical protein
MNGYQDEPTTIPDWVDQAAARVRERVLAQSAAVSKAADLARARADAIEQQFPGLWTTFTAAAGLIVERFNGQIGSTLVQQDVSSGHYITWVEIRQTSYKVSLSVDEGYRAVRANGRMTPRGGSARDTPFTLAIQITVDEGRVVFVVDDVPTGPRRAAEHVMKKVLDTLEHFVAAETERALQLA